MNITESDPLPNGGGDTRRLNLRVLVNHDANVVGIRVRLNTAVLDADEVDALVAALLDAKGQLA